MTLEQKLKELEISGASLSLANIKYASKLASDLRKALVALDVIQTRLTGSIHRMGFNTEKTNEGHAYDEAREALKEILDQK